MTSLQFCHPHKEKPRTQIEWGTGKPKEHLDLAVPRNPTWRTSGEPTTQYYQLTKLKLSNIRDNDELVPKPQAVDVGRESINLPFPADHPYASHMPRYAVFPKFDSPDDPKRGVAARNHLPISSEMPANPFNVTVKQSIKGFPYRHEFQDCPPETERRPLNWPGEDFFDQPAKVHGNRRQYYPTPPKLVCPNLQDRSGGGAASTEGVTGKSGPDLSVSARTANALRNVERDQWHTTYQMQFTGLGPSNALELDNLQEKQERLIRTGLEDDFLHPRTQNTFDPTPPVDGRLARNVCPLPIHRKTLVTETVYDKEYTGYGEPTPKEQEEHRLLYGQEYVNLPDISADPGRDVTWRQLDTAARPGPCLEKVEKAKQVTKKDETWSCCRPEDRQSSPQPVPVPQENPYPTIGTPRHPEPEKVSQAKLKQDDGIEQIEAQNRWQVLEAQTPHHDLRALRIKLHKLPFKDQPAAFYRHEGRYNEERAGLYKTSYDPHILTGAMNADAEAGSELTNTLDSNLQSQFIVSLPAARLNEDVNAALKYSRTFNLCKPELSGDRREGPEVMQTFNQLKDAQRHRLQPPAAHQACPRVQEREVLEREATTMGRGYNVKKFLQQNNLRPRARDEPYTLMSTGNQSMARVRTQTFLRPPKKDVRFEPSVSIRTLPRDSPRTPSTRLEAQLKDVQEPGPPAPLLDSEDRNPPQPPPYIPPPPPMHPTPPAPLEQDLPMESFQAYDGSAYGTTTTTHPLRHSAPATPDTRTRRVHFADNVNNNAGGDESTETSSTKDRYRSFPQKPPSSAHGHGLIDSEYTDRFHGHILPRKSTPTPLLGTPEGKKIPHFDLGYKDDDRFRWQPGSGVPRPQTKLLKIQDAFSKTEVTRKFRQTFPEVNPYLGKNITSGRRHEFWGFNSHILHG